MKAASAAGIRALTSGRAKFVAAAPRQQLMLEFKHNALLSALAGGHSRHFVRLEQRLGVKISTRGNLIAIEGKADDCNQAARALNALYARLEAGEEIGPADVDAEIGFAVEAPPDSHKASGGALKTSANKLTRTGARRRRPLISN